MRRRLQQVLVLLLVGGTVWASASAAVAAPRTLCTVSDARVPEISGLVATQDGYAVVTDSNAQTTQMRLYFLDRSCKVVDARTRTLGRKPRDPEDLTRTPDGTFWVADTGDDVTAPSRPTVAVHVFPPSGTPTLHRLRYPDGPKDAEALLVQNGNVPVIVSKDPSGTAKVYVSTRPITGPENSATNAVPLRAAGTIRFMPTGTENKFGPVGDVVVTGAAMSADGKKVLLRTYADAYEWAVPDGDVAKALTTGKPRVTPLPDPALLGEAISFTADGTGYVTLAEGDGAPLQQWTPTAPSASPSAQAAPAADDSGFSLRDISLGQLTLLVVAIGIVGLGLLVAGVLGIVRSRRRGGNGPPDGRRRGGPDDDRPGGPETMQLPRVAGAVYGARSEGIGGPDGPPGADRPDDRIGPDGRPDGPGGRFAADGRPVGPDGRPAFPPGRPGAPPAGPRRGPDDRGARPYRPDDDGATTTGGRRGGIRPPDDRPPGDRPPYGRAAGGRPGEGPPSGDPWAAAADAPGRPGPPPRRPGAGPPSGELRRGRRSDGAPDVGPDGAVPRRPGAVYGGPPIEDDTARRARGAGPPPGPPRRAEPPAVPMRHGDEDTLRPGRRGEDTLRPARRGEDTIRPGRRGKDTDRPGRGEDTLRPARGEDTLRPGRRGEDTLRPGRRGEDTLRPGRRGEDTDRPTRRDDALPPGPDLAGADRPRPRPRAERPLDGPPTDPVRTRRSGEPAAWSAEPAADRDRTGQGRRAVRPAPPERPPVPDRPPPPERPPVPGRSGPGRAAVPGVDPRAGAPDPPRPGAGPVTDGRGTPYGRRAAPPWSGEDVPSDRGGRGRPYPEGTPPGREPPPRRRDDRPPGTTYGGAPDDGPPRRSTTDRPSRHPDDLPPGPFRGGRPPDDDGGPPRPRR